MNTLNDNTNTRKNKRLSEIEKGIIQALLEENKSKLYSQIIRKM